jgi:hypothetical protein
MATKVIFVSYVRLSDKTSRDWFIDYLIDKGVTVEYWDVVALVRDEYDEAAAKTTDYLHTLRTYSELENRLRRPENTNGYYVMVVTYAEFTIKLFRLMSKYNCKMLYVKWGDVPIRPVNRWRRLLSGLSNPLRLATRLFSREKAIAYRKLKLVKPFDIVFAAGKTISANSLYATKVVSINYADYDLYNKVRLENAAPIVCGHYAVFLDSYLPHHSDLNVEGWPAVDADRYYKSLSMFFEKLEAKYKIKVVIAAHPRANYDASNPFGGREIHSGRTAELVKNADFVIVHSSYSQSHAILNRKPIVFIYTDEMAIAYRHTLMNEVFDCAEYLDAAVYNIDRIDTSDQLVIKDVSLARYESYKYDFLTTPVSEHTTSREIFLRTINADDRPESSQPIGNVSSL